jgi:hypothetical protein
MLAAIGEQSAVAHGAGALVRMLAVDGVNESP